MVRKEVKDVLKQPLPVAYGILSIEDLVIRPCAYCKGTGEADVGVFVEDYQPCSVCDESGDIRVPSDYIQCRKCDGRGKENAGEYIAWFVPCTKCHGTGWAPAPTVYR